VKMTKEIQKNIFEKNNQKIFVSEEEFFNVLKLIAPGTSFRTALDGALQSGRGALIVVENERIHSLFEGGFRIASRFTPQKLIELCKMDGAIIIDKDFKKINYANVLLTPDSKIKSVETGTRHKAAERIAKQAETLAVAISERKNQIVLYYKNVRYPLMDTDELLRRANEHLRFLETQKKLFNEYVEKLDDSEMKNYFDLKLAVHIIQKGRIIQKMIRDLKKYSIELGSEATLIKLSLKEILTDIEKETELTIKDYARIDYKKSSEFLKSLNYNEILVEETILKYLDYQNFHYFNESVPGWRLLSKTSLSEKEIESLISDKGNLKKIIMDLGDEIIKSPSKKLSFRIAS